MPDNNFENTLKNGIRYFKEKKFKKSEEEFNSILKISPNNIEALFYCGLMNFQNKNYNKSEIFLKKIIKIDNKNRNANVILGLICTNLNKEKDAITYFLAAYENNNNE